MIEQERLVTTFCDIVRIDSPSGQEEGMAQNLTDRLTDLGFSVTRDDHGNVIASEEGSSPLMLSAHMDTVQPGNGIIPRIEGEIIRTDGTTILGGDCKAGVAAILEALESIKLTGQDRHPVQLVFTKGEEIGLVGARNLDLSLVQAREAIVFDGNGPVNKITSASPTYMSLDVHIKGRAAHAGVEPEKGLSAIKIASEIISQLPQGRLDDETTINIGTITGGTVRNAVPEDVSFSGEFRSRNSESLDLVRLQVLDTIKQVRKRFQEAIIQETLGIEFLMYSLSPDDPTLKRATEVLATLGLESLFGPSGGGTDANIFNKAGIRSVVVGMSTQDMHTTREHVLIPDLLDTARFCQALLTQR